MHLLMKRQKNTKMLINFDQWIQSQPQQLDQLQNDHLRKFAH